MQGWMFLFLLLLNTQNYQRIKKMKKRLESHEIITNETNQTYAWMEEEPEELIECIVKICFEQMSNVTMTHMQTDLSVALQGLQSFVLSALTFWTRKKYSFSSNKWNKTETNVYTKNTNQIKEKHIL